MSAQTRVASGGIGLGGALFVLFLGLRLTDHIDWAWYWVAAPLWVPTGIVLAIGLVLLVIAGVAFSVAGIASLVRDRKPRKAK